MTTWLVTMASMRLLFLRVIAIYHSMRSIIWSSYVLFSACHTAIGVSIVVGVIRTLHITAYNSIARLCVSEGIIIVSWLYLIMLVMEVYVFLLLLIHQYRTHHDATGGTLRSHSILGAIRQNQYIYLILVMGLNTAEWLALVIARPTSWRLLAIADPAATSVLVARFTFKLRAVGTLHVHLFHAFGDSTELEAFEHPSTYPYFTAQTPAFGSRNAKNVSDTTEPVPHGAATKSKEAREIEVEVLDKDQRDRNRECDGFVYDRADTRMEV